MPLLLIDLDNTLVDRDAAFRRTAADFLAEYGLPADDLGRLVALDAGGYTPRQQVAAAMAHRYGKPEGAIRAFLDGGVVENIVLPVATRAALGGAVAAGWTCVIVSNGRVAQQEAKIRRTGLDRLTQGWIISEAVGHKKPAPEIFQAAAAATGTSLDGAWMVGDSPHADIRGALNVGVRSVWVSGGRAWPEAAYRPTLIAEDTASALESIVRDPG